MRFLVAIVGLLLVVANADHHLAKPHHPGYHGVKQAFGNLERSLDALAYVLAVKGVPAKRVCGLDVPSVGSDATKPLSQYAVEKQAREDEQKAQEQAKYQAKEQAKKAEEAKKAEYSAPLPAGPVHEDVKLAVVKYHDKKKLEDALLAANAEITADKALLSAHKAELNYLKLEEKIAAAPEIRKKIETEIAKEQAEIKTIYTTEQHIKVVEEKLKKANNGKAYTGGFKSEKTKKGLVLADKKGNSLYTNDDEKDGKIQCTGECEAFFIPVPPGHVGEDADGNIYGAITRPDGVVQATCNGKPLYRFVSDRKEGQTNADNVGKWHVVKKSKSGSKKAKAASKKGKSGSKKAAAYGGAAKAKSGSKKAAKAKSGSKKAAKAKSASKKGKSGSKKVKAAADGGAAKAKSGSKKAAKAKSASKKGKSGSKGKSGGRKAAAYGGAAKGKSGSKGKSGGRKPEGAKKSKSGSKGGKATAYGGAKAKSASKGKSGGRQTVAYGGAAKAKSASNKKAKSASKGKSGGRKPEGAKKSTSGSKGAAYGGATKAKSASKKAASGRKPEGGKRTGGSTY